MSDYNMWVKKVSTFWFSLQEKQIWLFINISTHEKVNVIVWKLKEPNSSLCQAMGVVLVNQPTGTNSTWLIEQIIPTTASIIQKGAELQKRVYIKCN